MPKARLGVALLIPPPVAAEIDGLRRALGDGSLGRIPPHVTLVPPVNVREDRLGDALGVLRSAAGALQRHPLSLVLGPPATFLPDNPVLYLDVDGDVERLRALRHTVFTEPLARSLTWPWVPHVTVADEAGPSVIAAGLEALAAYRAEVAIERVHLLQEGPGRVWEPIADAPFGPPAVVGRGGLSLELASSELVDPEAAGLLPVTGAPSAEGGEAGSAPGSEREPDSQSPGPDAAGLPAGRPFAVTARRDGAVAGLAAGATVGTTAVLTALMVAPADRNQGIGTHLLAAAGSLAAGRGCTAMVAAGPLQHAAGGFLGHRGWAPEEPAGPPRLRRSL